MKRNLKQFLIITVLSFLAFNASFCQVKITKATNLENSKDKYLFIETPNVEYHKEIIQKLRAKTEYVVMETKTDSINSKSLIIVTNKKKGSVSDNAGQDCLIGGGACLLGILFVQAAGESYSGAVPPTNGFSANAFGKYVEGGGACLTAGLWATGVAFGIKGFVKLVSKPSKKKAVQTVSRDKYDVNKIIRDAGLYTVDYKTFQLNDNSDVQGILMPYVIVNL